MNSLEYKQRLNSLQEDYVNLFESETDKKRMMDHMTFINESDNEELLQYLRSGGLFATSSRYLEDFIEESTNWYFDNFMVGSDNVNYHTEGWKGTIKHIYVDKDTPLLRRRFASKLRLVLNYLEGKIEEDEGRMVTRVPYQWYSRYIGRAMSGSNTDMDMMENLLIKKGLLEPRTSHIPPYKNMEGEVTKAGRSKTYWLNSTMYEKLMSGKRVIIELEASELRHRFKDIDNLPEERLEVLLNVMRYNVGATDLHILDDKLNGKVNSDYNLNSYQKRLMEALLLKDTYVLLRNTTDNYGGRFYTSMTQLKSEMRLNLRYGYEKTVELDMSSAQMTILAGFISRKLGAQTIITDYCKQGEFYDRVGERLGLCDLHSPTHYEDFRRKDYIYEGEVMSRRDAVKLICMVGVYASADSKGTPKRDFDTAFRSMDSFAFNCLESLRDSDEYTEYVDSRGLTIKRRKNHLPRAMQKQEQLFIFSVVKELKSRGVKGITTIHDCIKCLEKDRYVVKEVMESKFEEEFGFRCKVNIDEGRA